MATVVAHAYAISRRNSRDTRVPEPLNEHTFTGGTNGQILVFDDSVTDIQARWTNAAALLQWFDVRAYGASPTATAAVNKAAIQAAIAACIAAGGGTVYVPEQYDIAGVITINMGAASNGLTLRGSSIQRSRIRQTTVGADILVCGANSAQVCDNLRVCDLTLDGNGTAGKALRLNNTLQAKIARLRILTSTYGIYCEGQNEGPSFRDINIDGCITGGFSVGNTNGAAYPSAALDYPIITKAYIGNLRISGTTTGTAFRIAAGVFNGQNTSGPIVMDAVRLESNNRDGMYISHATGVVIDGWSSEDHPDADATYHAFKTDGNSQVTATSVAPGRSGTTNKHQYGIYNDGADLTLINSPLILACSVTSVYTNGGITLVKCQLSSTADITFSNVAARNASTLIDNRDGSNATLIWPGTTPFITREAYGMVSSTLRVSNNFFLTDVADGLGVGGGDGYIAVFKNATTPPATNPAAGYGVLYMEGGSLKFKTSAGNVRVVAAL